MAKELLELLMQEEFNGLIDSFQKDSVSVVGSKKIDVTDKKGNLLKSIGEKMSIQDILDLSNEIIQDSPVRSVFRFDSDNYINFRTYYDQVNDAVKIITVPSKDAISVALTLAQDAEGLLNGILFLDPKNPDWVINPLHPAIALEIIKTNIILPDLVKMMIFTYRDEVVVNQDIKTTSKFLAKSMLSITEKLETVLEQKIEIRNQHETFSDIQILASDNSYVEIQSRIPSSSVIISPLQILTRGEMLPYYGFSLMSAGGLASNYPGNLSGNIKGGWYERGFDGLCTGNYSNRTEEGWRTINRINANSVWYDQFVNAKYKHINAGYIELACDIYTIPDMFKKNEGVADDSVDTVDSVDASDANTCSV